MTEQSGRPREAVGRNAAIVQEYHEGATSTDIAKRNGISRQRVWQILKRAGVQSRCRVRPNPQEMLASVRAGQLDTVAAVADAWRVSYVTARRALLESGDWDGVRAEMAGWRRARKQKAAQARVLQAYRALVAELGRPATMQEMKDRRIYLATIYRAYGKNYVSKLRQDAQGQ